MTTSTTTTVAVVASRLRSGDVHELFAFSMNHHRDVVQTPNVTAAKTLSTGKITQNLDFFAPYSIAHTRLPYLTSFCFLVQSTNFGALGVVDVLSTELAVRVCGWSV